MVVGLAVTRDGFPVRHWVFSGNTVDVSTVAEVKEDLRGWRLTRCVFVGDARDGLEGEPADALAWGRPLHRLRAGAAR